LKVRVFVAFLVLTLALLPPISFAAAYTVSSLVTPQPQAVNTGAYDRVGIAISAGLAVGLATLGAGLAISSAGTAAISALAEKPETFFRSFLVVALAEALAIYGLIMGILLWIKL
jgi:V/A-type H+/Na+-transporting ATPase subunit K